MPVDVGVSVTVSQLRDVCVVEQRFYVDIRMAVTWIDARNWVPAPRRAPASCTRTGYRSSCWSTAITAIHSPGGSSEVVKRRGRANAGAPRRATPATFSPCRSTASHSGGGHTRQVSYRQGDPLVPATAKSARAWRATNLPRESVTVRAVMLHEWEAPLSSLATKSACSAKRMQYA